MPSSLFRFRFLLPASPPCGNTIELYIQQRTRTHLLKSSLGAERGQVRPDKAVALLGNLLQVHVRPQLHVLGVDAQDLHAP